MSTAKNPFLYALWFILLSSPLVFADVVINEIMYHPVTDGENAEYVELYNTQSQPVDLTGWRFDDGITFVFPSGSIINANGFLVVCRNELFIRSSYSMDESMQTAGNFAPSQLSNGGERILLLDAAGRVIDRVSYSDNPPWPSAADGGGASLELVHPLADNNNVLYWRASQIPTPGAPNSRAVAVVLPRIRSIEQIPQAPTQTDQVRIEIQFADDDLLQNVSLTYMVNGGAPQSTTLLQEGDRYAIVLPSHPHATVIEYWITATNTSGYSILAPAGSMDRLFTYRVDNDPIAAGSILINEIMYNNPASPDEDKEWVELFNPNGNPIDLSYWQLKDSEDLHVFRLPNGTVIPAQGYLLIARERGTDWTAPTVEGLSFSLDDGGDMVRLFDPNDRLIASVTYDNSGEWPQGADGEGGTLELLQSWRSNDEPNNWGVSPWGGTPGKLNARAIPDPNYNDFDVVINEIFYHPEEEEYDGNLETEYVELFNRSARSIDLSGWHFSRGIDFQFPLGTIIPGQGYLLVCRNVERYPDVRNKIGNFALQLSNGGEALALTNNQSIVIDYVRYRDSMPWPVLPDGEGHSLELISPQADNRIPQYWRSGQPNSPGRANAVVVANTPPRISDASHNPTFPTAQSSQEQVETFSIIRTGETWRYRKGNSAPPNNWTSLDFDDSDWLQGPSGFGYGDNDDATILSDMQNRYLSVYIRKTFTLGSLADFSQLLLNVDYDDGFVAYLNGVEVARSNVTENPPAFDRSATSNHEAGTPESFDISSRISLLRTGKNVLCLQGHNVSLTSSDFSLIPSLEYVHVIPPSEEGADRIRITALVEDEDGVDQVVLHYQRLYCPLGTGLALSEWKRVPMVDDGALGDAVAGDSIFTFTLDEAETIRPNELWRYKISAKDKLGNESILPLQDELTRNFIVFVGDHANPAKYPTVRIFMERTVLNWLNRNVESNDEQPCIVVMGGEAFDLYHAGGIRYRGDVLRDKPKKSWKIRFAKGNRWQNQRAINLNANYQTSPLVRGESGFMEHLAYRFFHENNVPAADSSHWRMMLNGDYYGLFIMAEQYNEDFVSNHNLPPETLIFKAGVKSRRSFLSLEPDFATYAQKYEFMMGRNNDIQILIDFIEQLNNDSIDSNDFFETHLDVETYLNYLACVAALSHVDSTEKNYFSTRGADNRWYIQPWDISHAWGEIHTNSAFPFISTYNLLDGAEGGVFGVNTLRRKFLRMPEFRQRYFQKLRDFTDHNFTREHLDPIFDAYWDYLRDAIDEDTQRWNSPGRLSEMVSQMKQYVTNRIAFIRNHPDVRPAGIPEQPLNVSPTNGAQIAGREVRLTADLRGEVIVASQWELQIRDNDFSLPLWTRTTESGNPANFDLPAGILASGSVYYWRVRSCNEQGLWSDWSSPTSFNVMEYLLPPDVQNVVAIPFDRSARLEWDQPLAGDLIRVDIFDDANIVESTPIDDNRVRIRGLENGRPYTFTIRTVSRDRQVSPGVSVTVTPFGPPPEGTVIAWFRFEGDAADAAGFFPDGRLLGSASISAPGSENPIPLNQLSNLSSLNVNGINGNGFVFGSNESVLDIAQRLTIECYAQIAPDAFTPMILVDRYDDANAPIDGVWRFAVNLTNPGSLDFFFNDGDADSGYTGRLHITTAGRVVPTDGAFHHYAVVLNLTSPTVKEKVHLFVDGIPILSTAIYHDDGDSDYDRLREESDLPVMIGARRAADGTTDVLRGRIDEVRITAGVLDRQAFLHPSSEQPSVDDWSLY
jgi:spore coat protein CotH